MNAQCDIGLVGLAVMGQNLVLNMADHGFEVAVYNRTTSKVDEFLADSAKGKSVMGCKSPGELVDNLKKPRRIMLMVKAGNPVGQTIRQFAPLLEAGDIIIDGGNSSKRCVRHCMLRKFAAMPRGFIRSRRLPRNTAGI